MKLNVIILLGFILICGCASALKFDEKINVDGGGYMLSQTKTEQSSDLAEGHGAQTYHRSLSTQLGVSSLESEYMLKSDDIEKNRYSFAVNKTGIGNKSYVTYNVLNPSYAPNRYKISMNSPSGLRHSVFVNGLGGSDTGDLISSSSIIFKPTASPPSILPTSQFTVFTSYSINGTGSATEVVADSSLGRHVSNIAETTIFGNFGMKSRLTDSVALPTSGEAESQSAKADSVRQVTDFPQANQSSLRIADLESMLLDGLITQEDYLNKMQDMLSDGSISANQYATSLINAFENNLIQLSYENYSFLLHKAASGTLNELNEMVNDTLISPDEYLIKLEELLHSNRITEAEYLEAIRNTRAATSVSDSQYLSFKSEAFDEMMSKYTRGAIDWPAYLGKLNAMLKLGVIDQADYDFQIQRISSAAISELEDMLDLGVTKPEFAAKLLEMKESGRISVDQYDQELTKYNITH
jgi:hypothetical protein